MAGVSTLFLPVKSLPKTESKDFIGGLEICRAMETVVGPNKVDGSIRISGLWRLQVKDEKSRSLLLRMGLPIRGLNCTVLSKNPYHIGDEESVKLIVGNLPFSIAEDEIRKALISIGVNVGSSLQWEHYREEKDPNNPDKIQGLTSFKTGRRFAYIAKPNVPLPQRLKVANKFNAFLYYKGQKEALEAAEAAAAAAATRAKAFLASQSDSPRDGGLNDETAAADASQSRDPTNGGIETDDADAEAEAWDAMLAVTEARALERNNQNAHADNLPFETSSLHGDITKDNSSIDDVETLSPITSQTSGSDPRGEPAVGVVIESISHDTLTESLSDITKPKGAFETKGASILDSVLRFSWGRRGRSPKTSKTRRDQSRSTSRQRRKPKDRHAAVKRIQSHDGYDRVGPLDTFVQTKLNTNNHISPESGVSEETPT